MKLNSSLVRFLGAIGAIALPAVVVAQTFTPNAPLTAASLTELARRIGVLEGDGGVGNTVVLSPTPRTTDGTLEPVSFTSHADGIVSLFPSGNSFESAITIVRTNIGGTQAIILRSTGGTSASFPVRNGQTFTVEATVPGPTRSADINLYFTPIRGNDAF